MTDMSHLLNLRIIALEDVAHLEYKERTYKGSWKRRGGVGAYMMIVRKSDRLEGLLEGAPYHYDVFSAIDSQTAEEKMTSGVTVGSDGTVLAEVRDLRRYLLLVEAEMVARGVVTLPNKTEAEKFGASNDKGAPDPVHPIAMGQTRTAPVGAGIYVGEPLYPGTPEDGGHHELGSDVRPAPSAKDQWEVYPRRDRYDIELNSKEYSLTPLDVQPFYRWKEQDQKWVMDPEYRERWARI